MTTPAQTSSEPVLARLWAWLQALTAARPRRREHAAGPRVSVEALQVGAELAGFAAFVTAGFLVGLVAGFVVLGVCLLVVGNVRWR